MELFPYMMSHDDQRRVLFALVRHRWFSLWLSPCPWYAASLRCDKKWRLIRMWPRVQSDSPITLNRVTGSGNPANTTSGTETVSTLPAILEWTSALIIISPGPAFFSIRKAMFIGVPTAPYFFLSSHPMFPTMRLPQFMAWKTMGDRGVFQNGQTLSQIGLRGQVRDFDWDDYLNTGAYFRGFSFFQHDICNIFSFTTFWFIASC